MTTRPNTAMASLSNDIVLMIAGRLDIDTFLAFRQTCRKYHDLIESHMNGLAAEVIRATFRCRASACTIEQIQNSEDPAEKLRLLKWLRFEELSAISVELMTNIPVTASDPLGQNVRSCIAKGWHGFARLCRVAQVVERLPLEEIYHRSQASDVGQGDCVLTSEDLIRFRELELASRWLEEIQLWSVDELSAYQWLSRKVVENVFAFWDPWDYWPRKTERPAARWVMGWMARHGPQPFWDAWSGSTTQPLRSMKDNVEATWSKKAVAEIDAELESTRALDRGIKAVLSVVRHVLSRSQSQAQKRALQAQGMNSHKSWDIRSISKDLCKIKRLIRARDRESGSYKPSFTRLQRNFVQKLDWKAFGWDAEAEWQEVQRVRKEMKDLEARTGRRLGEPCGSSHRSRALPILKPEFEQVLEHWEARWLEGILESL